MARQIDLPSDTPSDSSIILNIRTEILPRSSLQFGDRDAKRATQIDALVQLAHPLGAEKHVRITAGISIERPLGRIPAAIVSQTPCSAETPKVPISRICPLLKLVP